MVALVTTMLKDAWAQRLATTNNKKDSVKREIAQLDKQLDGLLERIVETDNPTVIAAYEKKIAKLEQDKLVLADNLAQEDKPKHSLDEISNVPSRSSQTLGTYGKKVILQSEKHCLEWCFRHLWHTHAKTGFELRKPL